jgi:DNA-directed RNA polymerase specialized sigma54-like protein
MNPILQQIQHHAAALPLSAQAELLNYAAYLEQKTREKTPATSPQARRDRLAAALAQAVALNPSPSDRLALVSAIIESLQDQPVTEADRSSAIQRMKGLLKTDQPAPTDEEVAAMLDARRTEKYL